MLLMPRLGLPTPSLVAGTLAASTACAIALGMVISRTTKSHSNSSQIFRATSRESGHDAVYPQDIYPGGRDVVAPYGTIKVFEWGPEDGEKVLIMQGIGTPSLGYADMAKEFVSKGYRVMTYGKHCHPMRYGLA